MSKKTYLLVGVAILVLVLLIGIYWSLGLFLVKEAPLPTEPINIQVNAASNLGEIPELFKAGIWWAYTPTHESYNYILPKFFNENRAGKVQLDIVTLISGSQSFEDYKKSLEKATQKGTLFRDGIEEVKKSGETLIIGHWPFPIPEWLSSRAGDNREFRTTPTGRIRAASPPKCYQNKCFSMAEIVCYNDRCQSTSQEQLNKDGYVLGWEGVIDYTLRYFRDNLGVKKLGYYHGHEQNADWIGTEEDFYKTYEYTVKAAKNIDPTIVVGGVGPSGLHEKRIACNADWYNEVGTQLCQSIIGWSMDGEDCKDKKISYTDKCRPTTENFLKYAGKKKLPVDFINFHMFGHLPETATLEKMVEDVKSWLKNNGFSETTPIYPADWAMWQGDYPADYIDTEANSSYVINALYYMDKTGIQWHGHDFNVFDGELEMSVIQQRGQNTQFIGDWPIFTRDKIIKPVYNAFKALSIFAGKPENQTPNRLQASLSEDGNVVALSSQTKDQKTTRILLSNFIPKNQPMLNAIISQTLNSCMLSKGYSSTEYGLITGSLRDAVRKNPPKGGVTGITKEYLIQIINQTDFPDPLDDQKVRQDLKFCLSESIVPKLRKINYDSKNPREVNLTLSNLTPGAYTIKKYLIDKNHSNSCRYNYNSASDKSVPCGINGEIDRKVAEAKREAGAKAKQPALDYLRNKGYTTNDFNIFKEAVRACQRKLRCLNEKIDQGYQKLERCQTKGIYDPQKCPSSETVKSEAKQAFEIFKQTKEDDDFYNSVDKINNQKGIALEMVEQKRLTITAGQPYQETIKMEPFSVLLIEITK